MNPKSFYRLLFVTVASVAAAVALWIYSPSYSTDKAFGEKLNPRLLEKINDVSVMSIEHEGETTNFLKDAVGNWFLIEADNYPASKERIRNVLIGLANLEKIEPKTALPEYYPDIAVEDAGEKSQSYLVTLLNGEGQTLLNLLVGKSTRGISWNGQGYFVRKPDEAQSWLVRGSADVTGGKLTWLDTELASFAQEDMASVSFIDSTKKREAAFKYDAEVSKLQPSYASDNYFQKSDRYVDRMTKALTTMDFVNVGRRPAGLEKLKPYLSVRVETNSGLLQYFLVYLINDTPYAALDFNALARASESVKNYAKTLQKGFEPWIYQIPAAKLRAIDPFIPLPEGK
ncbi:MAG TPA: hypothetical protein DD624_05365 [Alphaproteobacteria bacterium]|nr:hypothetical protein [Alphaproteobacteria bacterium]